jgi:hypothetical protein
MACFGHLINPLAVLNFAYRFHHLLTAQPELLRLQLSLTPTHQSYVPQIRLTLLVSYQKPRAPAPA